MKPTRQSSGTATATAGSSTSSIAVSMPYTGDNNANNTYTVDYKLSSAGSFTNWVTAAAHAASPYATTITGLTPGEMYDVRVTYNDADGVIGTNPQTISSIVVPITPTVTNWVRATGTAGPVTVTNASFSCGAGSNRLLVAAVVAEYSSTNVMTLTATKGTGVNFTQAVETSATTRTGVWIGYLTESQIASNTNSIVITENSAAALGHPWTYFWHVIQVWIRQRQLFLLGRPRYNLRVTQLRLAGRFRTCRQSLRHQLFMPTETMTAARRHHSSERMD